MDLRSEIDRIAAVALAEDGAVDVTTAVTVPPALKGESVIELRSDGVFAGVSFADAVARQCGCTISWDVVEGQMVPGGTRLGTIQGQLALLLRAERPLLNLLQRAGGIATLTRSFVHAIAGTPCRVLHTRKTAPGLRALDVTAVVAGGGAHHRLDLAHEIMVKDNHWQALRQCGRGLADVLAIARAQGVTALYVEVESREQLEEACAAGATRLLVDNQSPQTLEVWAVIARRLSPAIEIEATGGVTLQTARVYAEAGADFISVGALTHSVVALDVAMDVRVL